MSTTDVETSEAVQQEITALAVDLRWEHRNAGEASYRTIARAIAPRVSVATICRALKGERLPSWEFVQSFLSYCGVPTATIAGAWRPRWVAIQNMIKPIPTTSNNPGTRVDLTTIEGAESSLGSECTACGAWVTNMDRHVEWHDMFIPVPRTALAGPAVRPVAGRVRRLAG